MARILIVEDEPEIAAALAYDLKLEGYEVEVVRDGETASLRGREPGWDLVLLDVMLPKMDGFDVCRELRKAGLRTPILFLTARTHEAEMVLGLDLGADDYVEVARRNIRMADKHTDLIVRHMILPGHMDCCTRPTLEWLAMELPHGKVSLRTNYVPPIEAASAPKQYVTAPEAEAAIHQARDMGLHLIQ